VSGLSSDCSLGAGEGCCSVTSGDHAGARLPNCGLRLLLSCKALQPVPGVRIPLSNKSPRLAFWATLEVARRFARKRRADESCRSHARQ
jgi:hypothetical protein